MTSNNAPNGHNHFRQLGTRGDEFVGASLPGSELGKKLLLGSKSLAPVTGEVDGPARR